MLRPSHWPSFKTLHQGIKDATTIVQVERLLREAKAQFNSGALTRPQLQKLRDEFHWKLEKRRLVVDVPIV